MKLFDISNIFPGYEYPYQLKKVADRTRSLGL